MGAQLRVAGRPATAAFPCDHRFVVDQVRLTCGIFPEGTRHPRGISTLVASVPNKSKRCLEFTFIPELNYTRPGTADWQCPLIEECAWRGFMVPKCYNPVQDDNYSQVYPTAAGPSLVDPHLLRRPQASRTEVANMRRGHARGPL